MTIISEHLKENVVSRFRASYNQEKLRQLQEINWQIEEVDLLIGEFIALHCDDSSGLQPDEDDFIRARRVYNAELKLYK